MSGVRQQNPLVLIFMGVAGCGKTTVAKLFSEKTGAVFHEGDDFHPAENIARMRCGIPLTDDDRSAWLAALQQIIQNALAKNSFTVVTCSALKAKYREQLQLDASRVKFIHLTASREVIAARLATRRDHFMPASLVDSQFAILEVPTDAITFSGDKSPEEIANELIQLLALARTT